MKKFVVTYKYNEGENVICNVMGGNELSKLYGFSDCTGAEVLKVWEVCEDGDLCSCAFWENGTAPFNVLMVHRLGNYEPYEYEWPEH